VSFLLISSFLSSSFSSDRGSFSFSKENTENTLDTILKREKVDGLGSEEEGWGGKKRRD
jgi:hypothetical protein